MTLASASTLRSRIVAAGYDWIVPSWPAPPNVCAFATTKNGGVSAGRYATLNLGASNGDDPAAVAANRGRIDAFVPSRPMWLDQMHGADVAIFRNNARAKNPRAADAAVTCERDVVLSVLIADCLPVLFAERNGRVVGIAHAGWRGLARGVLETTVAAMDVAAEDIVAWLGPAIGMHAFEVGDDVIDAFADSNIAACFRLKRVGKWNADLYAIARARLARCGVHDVHGGGYCTFTDRARFFSYRRDGQTGRMAALIWIAS